MSAPTPDVTLPPAGTIVEWRNARFEIERHGCSGGLQVCKHANPIAGHELLTSGKRRYRHLLQCLPGADVTIVEPADTSPEQESTDADHS